MYLTEDLNLKLQEDLTDDEYMEEEENPEHAALRRRLEKTLYYGRKTTIDRPSLPLTEIAVEFFQDRVPCGLGQADTYFAASVGRGACVSPCSMMLGMMYIDRLKHKNADYLKTVSSSEAFLISMMVASKYLYDEGVDEEVFNDEWAESGFMETHDINQLERNFLAAMDWNLFVNPEDFTKVLDSVEQRIAMDQMTKRGFSSYTDLTVLLENCSLRQALNSLLLELYKVVTVCSIAYVAGVVTLVGSVATLNMVKQHIPVSTSDLQLHQHSNVVTSEPTPHVLPPLSNPDHDDEILPSLENQNPPSVSHFKLPSLLTVTLIQDTIWQFIIAAQERYQEIRNATKSRPDHPGLVCRHGACQAMDSLTHCHNVTYDGSMLLPNCMLLQSHSHCQDQSSGFRRKPTSSRCCCREGTTAFGFHVDETNVPFSELRVSIGMQTRLAVG